MTRAPCICAAMQVHKCKEHCAPVEYKGLGPMKSQLRAPRRIRTSDAAQSSHVHVDPKTPPRKGGKMMMNS